MELDGIRRKKTAPKGCCFLSLVRTERLELSHLSAPEPKSGASTNFATSAECEAIILGNGKKSRRIVGMPAGVLKNA